MFSYHEYKFILKVLFIFLLHGTNNENIVAGTTNATTTVSTNTTATTPTAINTTAPLTTTANVNATNNNTSTTPSTTSSNNATTPSSNATTPMNNTTNAATMTTTTTEATTTTPATTTTLHPDVVFHQKCLSYENWLPIKAADCSSPYALCFREVIESIEDYLKCKIYLNNTEPSKPIRDTTPMLLVSYIHRLSRNIINHFIYLKTSNPTLAKYETARSKMTVHTKYIFATGLKYRYGDLEWPNYKDSAFSSYRPKETWNSRNDSVTIPYGSLPSHEYQYEFLLFDDLVDTVIKDKEEVRLMDDWPDYHSIYTGSFVDYMADKNLYYIENLQINAAIIQVHITPAVKIPLPGEIILVFNNKNDTMKNPICVYWQYIKPDDPSEYPSAGYWSNYGVSYRNGNSSVTVCKAFHDGIFTVLMEKNVEVEEESDFWGLVLMLSMAGATVFSASFLAAMLMFKMHMNIYCRLFIYTDFSVFAFQVSFVYAYLNRDNWEKCTQMTTIMEVWQVQIITWLLLQNVHQLSLLRSFFNNKTNIDALYLILGWGIPIAVVVALQGFPHGQYDSLRYCWADFNGFQWFFYAGPIIVLALSTLALSFFITKEMKKSPEKADKDINFIRSAKGIKSTTIILMTLAASWAVGTFGLKTEGIIQTVLMMAQPGICIIMSGEMWTYYFSDNDAVDDALQENKRIKHYQRFRQFKHLEGIKMKVKYSAKEGDVETNEEELRQGNAVKPFTDEIFDEDEAYLNEMFELDEAPDFMDKK